MMKALRFIGIVLLGLFWVGIWVLFGGLDPWGAIVLAAGVGIGYFLARATRQREDVRQRDTDVVRSLLRNEGVWPFAADLDEVTTAARRILDTDTPDDDLVVDLELALERAGIAKARVSWFSVVVVDALRRAR
jgi:hypothetical protein